ncbi:MAG: ankyrin repeat domain-containing protein [Patescibacteria group bacterium]|nr:ankyrin repeat domain-containing protein [Patescibacteria group bacterium]
MNQRLVRTTAKYLISPELGDEVAQVAWLRYNRIQTTYAPNQDPAKTVADAAARGDVNSLKILYERYAIENSYYFKKVANIAAKKGNFSVLIWDQTGPRTANAKTCAISARKGDMKTLRWLLEQDNITPDERTINCLLERKDTKLLKLAIQKGRVWSEAVCVGIAYTGDMKLLKLAIQKGGSWSESVCAGIARAGDKEMLQWALEHDCPWDEQTCVEIAENGDVKLLKWARERGCPWDERVCDTAAKTGNLEMLQWAIRNGCPWDEYTCCFAVENGHQHILEWTKANGCACTGNQRIANHGTG